jgi:DNA-binding winged helix-turn-helix (wHTH) protein
MRVNSAFRGFFNNRVMVGSGIAIVMLAILFITSSFAKRSDHDLRAKQTNIIIREIGHRLLLQAGDRTSRVLPVIEIKEGIFQLTFEHRLVFNHDSLMALSQRLLPKTQFPSGYTVTVHDCTDGEIVYGFQINSTTPDILACRGRIQPRGCYIIEFTFPDIYETALNYPFISLVGSGLLVLSTVALLIGGFGKSEVPAAHQDNAVKKESVPKLAALGKYLFDAKNQRLLLGSEVINLTDKECKILELLNINFGELTPRETLMQIWVNEGVIIGRSLDMFVSKLRKKLSSDPELSITNVHGKGYKLEIPSMQILYNS